MEITCSSSKPTERRYTHSPTDNSRRYINSMNTQNRKVTGLLTSPRRSSRRGSLERRISMTQIMSQLRISYGCSTICIGPTNKNDIVQMVIQSYYEKTSNCSQQTSSYHHLALMLLPKCLLTNQHCLNNIFLTLFFIYSDTVYSFCVFQASLSTSSPRIITFSIFSFISFSSSSK